MLSLCDSHVSFGARYMQGVAIDPVRDMVLLDPFNPRSVAFQVEAICAASSPTCRCCASDGLPEAHQRLAAQAGRRIHDLRGIGTRRRRPDAPGERLRGPRRRDRRPATSPTARTPCVRRSSWGSRDLYAAPPHHLPLHASPSAYARCSLAASARGTGRGRRVLSSRVDDFSPAPANPHGAARLFRPRRGDGFLIDARRITSCGSKPCRGSRVERPIRCRAPESGMPMGIRCATQPISRSVDAFARNAPVHFVFPSVQGSPRPGR